jgi:DNA-binding transcriptional LysR family regulator
MSIDVREIRQVAAVASEGGFAKAAKVLHISQPALSRSIQEVERKAGFRIFERGRQGALLTDAGRSFMRQAGDILSLADNLERELTLIKGLDTGDLYIGAGVFAGNLLLGEALAPFARRHTQVRIRVLNDQPDTLIHLLRRRELDIVVADPEWIKPATDVAQITMNEHRGYLIVRAGHPLLGMRKIPVSDLVDYPLVTMGIAPNRIAQMGRHLKGVEAAQHKLIERWPQAIAVNSITSMKTTVANSDAVTMVSLKMVRHELDRKELAVLPLSLPWLKTHFAVMHLTHRTLSPLAEAVTKSIIAEDKNALKMERALAARWFKAPKGRRGAGPGRA